MYFSLNEEIRFVVVDLIEKENFIVCIVVALHIFERQIHKIAQNMRKFDASIASSRKRKSKKKKK